MLKAESPYGQGEGPENGNDAPWKAESTTSTSVATLPATFHDPHLLRADRFVADREPDFTFRTDWIDFPAGPADSDLDASFTTVGNSLNDHIYDISDPSKLDEPFCSLFLRFTGFIKMALFPRSRFESTAVCSCNDSASRLRQGQRAGSPRPEPREQAGIPAFSVQEARL